MNYAVSGGLKCPKLLFLEYIPLSSPPPRGLCLDIDAYGESSRVTHL